MSNNYLEEVAELEGEVERGIEKSKDFANTQWGIDEDLKRNEDEDNPGEITGQAESALTLDECTKNLEYQDGELEELRYDIEEKKLTPEKIEEKLSEIEQSVVDLLDRVDNESPD